MLLSSVEKVKVWKRKCKRESVKEKLWKCDSTTCYVTLLGWESESLKLKVWNWNCESESVKVWLNRLLCYSPRLRKLKCESESVKEKLWKWKCKSVTQPLVMLLSPLLSWVHSNKTQSSFSSWSYDAPMLQCNNVTIIQYSNHCASTEIQLTLILGCSNIMSAEARRLKFQNLGGKLILSQWRETSSKV